MLGSGTPIGLPFIYLDAHWNDDLPLPEEIDIIAKDLRNFFIFVDDFQQPDAGYGFDRYENGNELTLDFPADAIDMSSAADLSGAECTG